MGKLIHEDLTYKIIGILFKVHTALGCGFPEKIYQRAIEVELEKDNIPYKREQEFRVTNQSNIYLTFLILNPKLKIPMSNE
ncbi:MAG: GxxExxY protein [bacterium]|nr:GxxExxY protein [bacterium]